ncbi:MAG: hypothetical protein RLP15_10230 [Cryomorphaceae bacterium]
MINLIIYCFLGYHTYQIQPSESGQCLFLESGETRTFLEPIERLVNGEGYSWQTSINRYKDESLMPSTRRTPGFLPIYAILYQALGENGAREMLVLIQIILSLISYWVLGDALYQRRKNIYTLLGFYCLITCIWYDKYFAFIGLGESLSLSLSILGIALLYSKKSFTALFFIGCLLGWSVFMRPAMMIFFICVIGVYSLVLWSQKIGLKNLLTRLIFLGMPISLALLCWTMRNFQTTGKFIVVEDSIYESQPHLYSPTVKAIRRVIFTLGDQYERWIPNSAGEFFFSGGELTSHNKFGTTYGSDSSIIELKKIYWLTRETTNRSNLDSLDLLATKISDAYINGHIELNPSEYYIVRPIRMMLSLLTIRSYSYIPFPSINEMSLFQKVIKGMQWASHYLFLLALVVASYSLSVQKLWNRYTLTAGLFILCYLVTLAWVFGFTEPRYLVAIYPCGYIILSDFLGHVAFSGNLKTDTSADTELQKVHEG